MDSYSCLADVYELMMEDVDYAGWASYLHGFLKRGGVKRVFEAACGTGAVTRQLYDLGYDITAADSSEAMLRVAAQYARKGGRQIRFVQQDLRRVETPRPVDALVCACDGVIYVDPEGALEFLTGAYAALRPGGLLLFDISTRYKLRDQMDGQVWFDDTEDAACIWSGRYNEAKTALEMDVTLFVRRGALFERQNEKHVQYAHDVGDLRRAALETGFSRVDTYEAFTENPVSTHSVRAQFVCAR